MLFGHVQLRGWPRANTYLLSSKWWRTMFPRIHGLLHFCRQTRCRQTRNNKEPFKPWDSTATTKNAILIFDTPGILDFVDSANGERSSCASFILKGDPFLAALDYETAESDFKDSKNYWRRMNTTRQKLFSTVVYRFWKELALYMRPLTHVPRHTVCSWQFNFLVFHWVWLNQRRTFARSTYCAL